VPQEPEATARAEIDRLLTAAGRVVQGLGPEPRAPSVFAFQEPKPGRMAQGRRVHDYFLAQFSAEGRKGGQFYMLSHVLS
jgi:hypothetical protein